MKIYVRCGGLSSFYGPRYGTIEENDGSYRVFDFDRWRAEGKSYEDKESASSKASELNLMKSRPHSYIDDLYKYCSKRPDGCKYQKFKDYFTCSGPEANRYIFKKKLESFKKSNHINSGIIKLQRSHKDDDTLVVYEHSESEGL